MIANAGGMVWCNEHQIREGRRHILTVMTFLAKAHILVVFCMI